MKTNLKPHLLSALFGLLASTALLVAQGTAINYQGHLEAGGAPANGLFDLSFSLQDQVGNQYGSLTNSAVPVSNGVFTVTLDFGPSAFVNGTRWLELAVRKTVPGSTFITLTPRQQILPEPYAIFASSAGVAGSISGTLPASGLAGLYSNPVNFNHLSNIFAGVFNGSFVGNGAELTGVNVSTLGGLGPEGFWHTGGNAGTTPGADFLGTVDARPLELRANNSRGLRLDYVERALKPPFSGSYSGVNVVGGAWPNSISAGVIGATIAGGGLFNEALFDPAADANAVTADYGTVGGGIANQAGAYATVSGGNGNISSGSRANVSGGEFNQAQGDWSGVGGGSLNQASKPFATVAGGSQNVAGMNGAFVGGGTSNLVSGTNGVIGGGSSNWVTGAFATVGGGLYNQATGRGAFVGGGGDYPITGELGAYMGNIASGDFSAVGAGFLNFATGNGATVPGGVGNQANGASSFAAGTYAMANRPGTFVWADKSAGAFVSSSSNQFLVRAAGGARFIGGNNWNVTSTEGDFRIGSDAYRFKLGIATAGGGAGDVWMRAQGGTARLFLKTPGGTTLFSNEGETSGVNLPPGGGSWSSLSDRNAKENLEAVNPQEVLEKVAALPLATWNYKSQEPSIRHLGPMAQDFRAAFSLGESETGITSIDADGVALAATQGLCEILKEKDTELRRLKQSVAELKSAVDRLMEKSNGAAQ